MKKTYPDPRLAPLVIVDDSDDDVFLLRHRLREGGITHPIHAFGSPTEALAFLGGLHQLPEIVFTDIRMPVGCGFALIAAIRENPAWDAIRIAVVSMSNEAADFERAIALGANGYLLKFPPADLLAEFVHSGPWISVHSARGAALHAALA
ncbi:MAG TPA: response regulator [Opitutaceae bacterium]|nr:response regulator [Opitutaceae bacterium]